MHFTLSDWVFVGLYLGASLAAGLYGKKYLFGVQEFLVAGRELGAPLGIASLAATNIGTITFMYFAELGYKTGFAAFVTTLISGGVMFFMGWSGFIVHKLRALNLMTVPEFFEIHYDRRLRAFAGALMAIGGLLNMGVFLKVEGTFIAIITGIPLDYLKLTMTAILAIELLYTVLGGMVSVVITDFIQFVFVAQAALIVTVYSIKFAGWSEMHRTVVNSFGIQGFNPIKNPQFGWASIIFLILSSIAGVACWQPTAMRGFSTRSPETSKRVFFWTGLVYWGVGLLPMIWGIAALTVLGPHENSLTAMPIFLARILPAGILGLVVAGMLAATMSVNSSYLLGWSSIIAQDIVLPLRSRSLDSRAQMTLNRLTNLFASVFVLFWGVWYKLPGPVFFYLVVTAAIFLGGTFACIVGGLYWARANASGAYTAMIVGALSTLGFFVFHFDANYSGLASFVLAGVGMIVGSLLGGTRQVVHHRAAEQGHS